MQLNHYELEKLINDAGYYQTSLKVTPEFYDLIRKALLDKSMLDIPYPYNPHNQIPVGPRVEIVQPGQENIKLIDGVWRFVNE